MLDHLPRPDLQLRQDAVPVPQFRFLLVLIPVVDTAVVGVLALVQAFISPAAYAAATVSPQRHTEHKTRFTRPTTMSDGLLLLPPIVRYPRSLNLDSKFVHPAPEVWSCSSPEVPRMEEARVVVMLLLDPIVVPDLTTEETTILRLSVAPEAVPLPLQTQAGNSVAMDVQSYTSVSMNHASRPY